MTACIDPEHHVQPCGRLSCIGLADEPPQGWNKIVGPSTDAEIPDYLDRRGSWKHGGIVDRAIEAIADMLR
jgi:hypothetical protein